VLFIFFYLFRLFGLQIYLNLLDIFKELQNYEDPCYFFCFFIQIEKRKSEEKDTSVSKKQKTESKQCKHCGLEGINSLFFHYFLGNKTKKNGLFIFFRF
jgi:hypothetical protein